MFSFEKLECKHDESKIISFFKAIKKYNLDEIKDLPSKSLKDPKISLKLNPNIKSENVSYAKRKTKFLRKTR